MTDSASIKGLVLRIREDVKPRVPSVCEQIRRMKIGACFTVTSEQSAGIRSAFKSVGSEFYEEYAGRHVTFFKTTEATDALAGTPEELQLSISDIPANGTANGIKRHIAPLPRATLPKIPKVMRNGSQYWNAYMDRIVSGEVVEIPMGEPHTSIYSAAKRYNVRVTTVRDPKRGVVFAALKSAPSEQREQ
jgi:hypothetical protein